MAVKIKNRKLIIEKAYQKALRFQRNHKGYSICKEALLLPFLEEDDELDLSNLGIRQWSRLKSDLMKLIEQRNASNRLAMKLSVKGIITDLVLDLQIDKSLIVDDIESSINRGMEADLRQEPEALTLKSQLKNFGYWIIRNQKEMDLIHSVEKTTSEYLETLTEAQAS